MIFNFLLFGVMGIAFHTKKHCLSKFLMFQCTHSWRDGQVNTRHLWKKKSGSLDVVAMGAFSQPEFLGMQRYVWKASLES